MKNTPTYTQTHTYTCTHTHTHPHPHTHLAPKCFGSGRSVCVNRKVMRSLALCPSLALLCAFLCRAVSEFSTFLSSSSSSSSSPPSSSKSDLDYEFGDYRGKWCIDDHGFVYNLGEVYYPGRAACPCTCTEDGPVCVRPKCPRIHPRCTRIRYKSCCPVCEAISKVCVYGGKTYRVFQEFRLSRCERCRCEPSGEVYCSISDCPALHCVNPSYEPKHCCPVCKSGPNCFAGNRIIPAGERVEVDEWTVCFCTYRDGTWQTHPHATCEQRQRLDEDAFKQMEEQEMEREKERERQRERERMPRLDAIP